MNWDFTCWDFTLHAQFVAKQMSFKTFLKLIIVWPSGHYKKQLTPVTLREKL